MQFKKTVLSFVFFTIIYTAFSQATYLPQGDKQYAILDRLEILAGKDSVLNFSKTKPFSRQTYVLNGLKNQGNKHWPTNLSKQDLYNIESIYKNNIEYLPAEEQAKYLNPNRVGKKIFQNNANFFQVLQKDFSCIVNPVLLITTTKEKNNNQTLFLNTRGVQIKGSIANRVGYFLHVTDNQERAVNYVQNWIAARQAIPGVGNFKEFKAAGGTDYFDARGYFNFTAAKYIQVNFGYDKNFIGNGYRSLFLSDFGNNNLFLKLQTRVWKINYQNLFMELHNAHNRTGDKLLGKKYVAMHHLDVAVTKWLNIGLFEAVVFGRTNRFDFSYLNPVIFYRSVELQNGSPDNAFLGGDFKANIAHSVQLYGQLLLDEFRLKEIKAGNGWWANKWAIQVGAKYVNAFKIRNLDLQIEHNQARPFIYSHTDSVANYTHYNQPLAHPLMANFKEWIGIVKYQPAPKWSIMAKAIHYIQGRDTGSINFGSNIFLPNKPANRIGDYGYFIGTGWKTKVSHISLLVSYELMQNLFIELYAAYRSQKTITTPVGKQSTSFGTIGVRWNIQKREFDF